MKTTLKFSLISIFVVGAVFIVVHFNTQRPRLLIVHSAGSETSSVLGINRGLRDQLRNKSNLNVRWYYSGLSDKPKSQAEEDSLRVRHLVDSWHPNVLVSVGDEAQAYVARHYVDDSNIRLVYCAVHDDIKPYGLDLAKNAGGFLVTPQLRALTDLLQDFARQLQIQGPIRVVHLGDQSSDVQDDAAFMSAYNWGAFRFIGNDLVDNFDEWQDRVRHVKASADFILTSDYRALARTPTDRIPVPPSEVIAWTVAHSPIPVIGTSNQYVRDGGWIAIFASPYEQGSSAGAMAIRLLLQPDSERHAAPHVPQEFVTAVRDSAFRSAGLILPDIYTSLAKATNNYFP